MTKRRATSTFKRLAVSPQCGFIGAAITEADECAKLRRVVELAEAIWA